MDKHINGLDLADYKEIESETLRQITNARRILMVSTAILDSARAAIKTLGGKTSIEEQKETEELRQKAKKGTV